MSTTLDLLKQQFTTLCQQRDAIFAASLPLRAQRDGLVQQAEAALAAQVAPINAEIATIEGPLPDLMNQIAAISTALDGKTGADAA
jgi:hypothetical protein